MNSTLSPVASGVVRPDVEPPVLGGHEHTDYYHLDELLTDNQRALLGRIRAFMDSEVAPVINGYWERAELPHVLVPKLAELNVTGFNLQDYCCPAMDILTTGLAVLEVARGDLSIVTFMGVQSALAMNSISREMVADALARREVR